MSQSNSILFSKALLAWYDRARRDLPWRSRSGSLPPAYHVFISEAMLQQTQVATVVPYFSRFLEAFPTIESLAAGDEQRVLRLWQGLGYYSRARNLRKAAIAICKLHGGKIPSDVATLLTLPGVGRYTAGAIASLAYDRPAPILDGNVVRVLCRIEAIVDDPRTPATQKRLWTLAEKMLPEQRTGDFNSALMELGATACIPKTPACLICPVQRFCQAFKQNIQSTLPRPKLVKASPLLVRYVLCARDEDGRYLVEQRPPSGRWASLWQFVTRDHADFSDMIGEVSAESSVTVRHALTHRRYEFRTSFVRVRSSLHLQLSQTRRWATPHELTALPMSRPHLKIRQHAELIKGDASNHEAPVAD